MIAYVSIPALVALAFKFILLIYTARSPVKNIVARLFLALLVAFTFINFDEFIFLNYIPKYGITPAVQAAGFLYVFLWIPTIALLLHLSLALGTQSSGASNRRLLLCLYAPALPIAYLLLFTDKLILHFRAFRFSMLRVPGPWYWIAESAAIVYLSATLLLLLYGARRSRPALSRIRARMWLLALAPIIILVICLIISHHLGWYKLTFPVHVPLAITFFLLVTTYATHERPSRGGFYRFLYRLFDIESYLPWCKAYRHKATLYCRIRKMIVEIGEFRSVRHIVRGISEMLQCPVMLVTSSRPAPLRAGDTREIAKYPREALLHIDRTVMAHQIARNMPWTHALMAQHQVAAIVPFYPHSRAASWMLFGISFTEQVYTPADFDVVQGLFDRLGGHLLDEQIRLRCELDAADRETRMLHQRLGGSTQRRQTERALTIPPGSLGTTLDEEMAHVQTEILVQAEITQTTLDQHVAMFERGIIARALMRAGGNQAKAAELLGLRPNTLHYKMRRYGLAGSRRDD